MQATRDDFFERLEVGAFGSSFLADERKVTPV